MSDMSDMSNQHHHAHVRRMLSEPVGGITDVSWQYDNHNYDLARRIGIANSHPINHYGSKETNSAFDDHGAVALFNRKHADERVNPVALNAHGETLAFLSGLNTLVPFKSITRTLDHENVPQRHPLQGRRHVVKHKKTAEHPLAAFPQEKFFDRNRQGKIWRDLDMDTWERPAVSYDVHRTIKKSALRDTDTYVYGALLALLFIPFFLRPE